MFINNSDVKIITGKLNPTLRPFSIFNSKVVEFLNELSNFIISDLESKKHTDLITFAFWCRKSNINKISKQYILESSIGRGTALHITPSNIPMNFAYSFAFGLLSGNYNIVRLPKKKFEQITLLCNIINKICNKKKYKEILNKFCFITYFRSDNISQKLSSISDARLIWGGNRTIENFKGYLTPPRCVDLYFADRHSISIINSSALKKLNEKEFKNFLKKFYNDAFLMDQQGCSSPQAVIWLKSGKIENIIEKFWKDLNSIVLKNYITDLSTINSKYLSLNDLALTTQIKFKRKKSNFNIVRLDSKKPNKDLDDIKCNFGTFMEFSIDNVNQIEKIISKKTQTLSYFGCNPSLLKNLIITKGLKGVDRIVPIGRSNDMGHIWDGYDIIGSLSRKIGE